MIDRCLVGKVSLVAAFLLFVSGFSFGVGVTPKKTVTKSNVSKEKNVNKNSFNTPDFAFPETVEKNAEVEYTKALKDGDAVRALQGAVQLTIAKDLVSSSNYKEGVEIFEELGDKLPIPYSSLAYLLEARLYTSIYNSNAWRYNQRVIPLTPVPEDVEEWSREIFAEKVRSLVERSTGGISAAKELGLKEISPLLENSADWMKMGMTVYDFMTLKGCEALGDFAKQGGTEAVIPFGNGKSVTEEKSAGDAGSLLYSLIDDNISWHDSCGETEQSSVMANYKLNRIIRGDRREFAAECVKKYIDTPYCASFLLASQDYSDREDEVVYDSEDMDENPSQEQQNMMLKRQYGIIESYLKRFPDCRNAGALKNRLSVLGAEKISVRVGRYYPGDVCKAKVIGENIFNFNLLIVKLPDSCLHDDVRIDAVKSSGRIVGSVPVSLRGEKPAKIEEDIELPALSSGVYVVVPSRTSSLGGIITGTDPKQKFSTFNVSRLASFRSLKFKSHGDDRFYVVDGKNQQPVAGANVKLIEKGVNKRRIDKVTNDEGFVDIPEGTLYIIVKKGNDRLEGNEVSPGIYEVSDIKCIQAKVLTDLSVYHPGDTIGFMGVIYSEERRELHPLRDSEVKVILRDANWQGVDTLKLVSDKFGRVFGKFNVPTTGLLGTYTLRICDKSSNSVYGAASVEVSDYKTPTFYVAAEGASGSYNVGDVISIKGKASTYSGLPVAGSTVKYEVSYLPLWWLESWENASYGGESETASDGTFEIKLPTEGLRGSRYAYGGYELKIAVTDPAGETQEAPAVWFSLGEAYSIIESLPEKICAEAGEQSYSVIVTDIIDKPVRKTVYYRISETGADNKTIVTGEFESPVFKFDPSSFKSGEYKIMFSLDKDFKKSEYEHTEYSTIIIYRNTDKTPPIETPIWIPENRVIAKTGEKSVKLKVGSSYADSWVFAQIADCDRVIDRRWIKINSSIEEIEVPTPSANNRVSVIFAGMRDFRQRMETVMIIPEVQTESVKVETLSFRDRITPGASERWRFRFSLKDSVLSDIPVSAVMTNQALNSIMPFEWRFDPRSIAGYEVKGKFIWGRYLETGNWTINLTKSLYGGVKNGEYPNWNMYGLSLYGGPSQLRSVKIRGGSVKEEILGTVYTTSASIVNEMKMDDSVDMFEAQAEKNIIYDESEMISAMGVAADGEEQDNGYGSKDEPVLRQTEYPLAFFMPDLITDANGETTVDFTVPEFNGTWQFQIMGYTEEMKGTVAKMSTVAAKPVMVSMNAPRFVRSGDRMSVAAMLFNNSTDRLPVSGKIEIFDPVTGKVLLAKESVATDLDPAGSSKMMAEYPVASELNYIGVRAYAYGASHADGEQTVIPVYPSSTPVVESEPFYLGPDTKEISMKVPSCGNGAKVTLQYSDNPIWDVVTALPDISEAKSSNILSLVYSLYGNAIGVGLVKDYPEIGEAIKVFADSANSSDSTLVSNLEKNQNLKNVVLNNTPWVQDASSETLRMQGLVKYSDGERSRSVIDANLKGIAKLQNADGGWSWCAGMQSSRFITARVLLHLAMLRDMGYLPTEGEAMAKRGIKYVDAGIVREVNEYKGKNYPYASLLNYLYVRSNFKDVGMSPDFAQISKMGVTAVKSSWKDFGIYEKATAATLLSREGYGMEARTVLESLRQFASVSPEKGMWFDNLSSSWNGWNKLITTAQVLEAYSEIEPKSENVDKLRQWLLVTKQAENWGDDRETAEVIHAILTSGTRWTVPSAPAEITLDDKPMAIDRVAALTGNFTVNLDPKGKETLSIHRNSAGPAWGSIISQYVAPIRDVKSSGLPELSVEKNIYSISAEGKELTATAGNLKVGDKVRVTLTVKCDRDLEYVAIMDARSACLEPADQLSGYSMSDGIWMYKEVRDDSTNLFIPFLGKGTHVISYECYVDREGEYSLGIASAQSQYAPGIAAHSAGTLIIIK